MNERPNIRRMQMPEEGSQTISYDPMKDISEDEWGHIAKFFSTYVDQGGTFSSVITLRQRLAADIIAINPKEKCVSADYRKLLENAAKDVAERNLEDLVNLSIFGRPNTILPPDLNVEQHAWLTGRLQFPLSSGVSYELYAKYIVLHKIYEPQIPIAAEHIAWLQFRYDEAKKKRWLPDMALYGAVHKVVDANYMPIAEDLQSIRAYMNTQRAETTWEAFLPLARQLAILTAERIDIKDRGLIVMPRGKRPRAQEVQSMPITPEI